jgi:hypothetical protein
MKKLFFITIILLLQSFPSFGDIQDYFWFKIGDQYKEVITLIDVTDPYNCSKKKKIPGKVTSRYSSLYNGDYGVSKIYKGVINSKVLNLISYTTDKQCKIERIETLSFCQSNGNLIHYKVDIPISKSWFLQNNPIFDETSEEFIGPNKGDIIIDSEFKGRLVSYETVNPKTNLYKLSWFSISGKNNNLRVSHSFYQKPKDDKSSIIELCPEKDDKISNFKPKYNSVNKVISTSVLFNSRYELSRKFVNKCLVLFPENKENYESYWKTFKKLNEDNFNKIKNKSEQIIMSLDQNKITKEYNDRKKSLLTIFVDELSIKNERVKKFSLDECNRFLKKPYDLKDSLENQYSLNRVDVDFVLNMKIK